MAKPVNEPFQFLLSALRRNPGVTYQSVRERAEKAGHTVHPIMYGRAKALLGLVPSKARADKAKADGEAALDRWAATSSNGHVEAAPRPTAKTAKSLLQDFMAEMKALKRFRSDVELALKRCAAKTTS